MNPPTDGFVAVANIADIPPGAMKCVPVDRVRVLLANVGGTFYAIGDMCGHRRAPLSAGELDGYLVECPLHYAMFDVRTGKFVVGPNSADVPAYETRIEGDTVLVRR
jgi:nitrite reductase/ring-hydroxylating ferredoxin subunit